MLLPALSRTREVGEQSECMARLRSLHQVTHAFALDNNTHLPDLHNSSGNGTTTPTRPHIGTASARAT